MKGTNNSKKSFNKKYLEKIEDSNYSGGSWDLPENPTALEKTKYDICEKILAHKQDNNLTIEKLAQQIKLSKAETEDIIYCRIDHFTLDRLMNYASKLFSPSEVRVVIEKKARRNGTLLHA